MPSFVLPVAALAIAVVVRVAALILWLLNRRLPKLFHRVVTITWFGVLPVAFASSMILPYDNGYGGCPPPLLNGGLGDGVLSGQPPEDRCERSAQYVVWTSGGLLFGVAVTGGILAFAHRSLEPES